MHNGKPISIGENLRLIEKDNIYTLSIENVTMDNDGEYTVKASNVSGSVQTSANLSVQGMLQSAYLISLILSGQVGNALDFHPSGLGSSTARGYLPKKFK